MWLSPWQIVRELFVQRFVRPPLMALARLGYFVAVWWL